MKMKTVQEWLQEVDEQELIDTYICTFPIDFIMIEDKSRTVSEVYETLKNRLRKFISDMKELDAPRSERDVFYAAHVRKDGRSAIGVCLSYADDILNCDLPEHYSWLLCDFADIMGYQVAETKLTLDHITTVLAHIIHEMTFFGFSQVVMEKQREELHESFRKAEEDSHNGKAHPAEEVFAKYGFPRDEPDEEAEELEHQIRMNEYKFETHSRKREASRVRDLLTTP